jgi:hypothetical protein
MGEKFRKKRKIMRGEQAEMKSSINQIKNTMDSIISKQNQAE